MTSVCSGPGPALLSSIPGLSQSNGINREGPGSDLGTQAGEGGVRNAQHFNLPVSSPPTPPPLPACSHSASRCRSRGANEHNIHLSIAGSVPGRPARCPWRLWSTGAAEHSFGGRGALSPGSTQGIIQKEGSGWVWGIIALSARSGKDSVGLRAEGALPPSPTPSLLIKAKNKEAAGEGGFDLTPPSQF